ncbi:efflux RND transporter permease subunit [Brachyspira hampsonii]|uniref:Acriflavin resistance protein n=3 Tax=Brachyspira hampsonii TaxID=1287055 RepID=A0A2U4EWA3_9SPIR|nr:efflux RND transporter permease subunit [Brachyspira hampsonii]EKV57245.1 acriflavin resistance protein [Brachyspira hampsonii 30446]MBW5388973.1 efflux RND transporter permease subunit [Brachyspira hampsonii]OEJ17287.1 acriflavin resistance protein [Brachyspira hampsonii]
MEKIIVFFAKKTMLVNIIVMAILFVGGYYYFNLRKESIPSTDLDMMLIAVTYPGATPLDVEQNAVIPIEEELQGISGIDEYETTIIENVAIILVTLDETLPDRQPVKDEIFRQMQNVPDLSEDVEEVTTYDLNPNKMSIYTLAVHFKEGMEGDERELFDVSQTLENELVRLEGVGEVRVEGRTDPEIKVYIDPIKMTKNYIALSDVVNALSIRNVRATGGDMESGGKEQTVVTYGEFQDPMEASNVIIRSTFNGQRVRVSDIGHVESGFEDKTTLMRVNRASGYSLSIVKNENADILKTIETVNQYLKDNADLIPDNIQVSVMGDNSRTIKSLLSIVSSNLIQGFIIIFITLIIFLDFKSAMFTSLGMIITMFSCFIYMQVTGITFNTMSLAAIITVLGMIVDNSIVVSENIFNFKQAGYKGLEATRLAVSDVVMPMVASTLTTVAAFFPMLTISGMMGKILNLFPRIVIFTLVVSMLQATLLLPNQLQDKEDKYKSYKPKKKSKFKNPLDFDKDALFDKMKIPFGAILEKLIHIRYIVIGAFVALLIASIFLAQSSFKNFVLIYDTSADTIVINIEMPTGTTKEATTKEIAKIEDVVASVVKPEELIALYSLVGKQVDQEVVSEEKGSLAGIMVYLVPAAERSRTADELVALINAELDKTDIRQTVPIFSMNTKGSIDPGDPVDIKIVGNNTELAKKAKDEIKEFLATVPGVINIDDDDKVGKEELRVMFDYDKIAELGVNVAGVANEVRTAYYGTEATYIQELENKLNFRVVFDDPYTYDIQYLTNLLIPNTSGRLIYLHNLADVEIADGLATLKHYNGQRTITITAGIEYGKNTSQQVMAAVSERFKDFSRQYRGLKLEFGGEAKETMKAIKQLIFSFAMAFIFVYIVLLLQLNRFIQPIMIMIIIPFGLIGVLLGFAIHRMPLSFMGVVGIIGLAGVVVNNGIILVDLINKIIDEGVEGGKKGVAKAIVDGAKQRLRPVFLTTVTTVVGLLPTVYGIGGRADIIIPIVMALAYGLLFASLLTLIFLPCMFMIMFDLRLIKIPPTKNPSEEITTTVTTA